MSIFTERLNQAMSEKGLKQIDLVEKTGFSKSKISHWVTGRYDAKQDGVYKLAKALGVTEAWLMGVDTLMDAKPTTPDERLTTFIGSLQSNNASTFKKQLITALSELSEEEWEVLERIVEKIEG